MEIIIKLNNLALQFRGSKPLHGSTYRKIFRKRKFMQNERSDINIYCTKQVIERFKLIADEMSENIFLYPFVPYFIILTVILFFINRKKVMNIKKSEVQSDN